MLYEVITIMLSVPLIMEKIYKNKIVPTFTAKESIAKLYAKPFFRRIFHRIAGLSLKKTFGGRRITSYNVCYTKLLRRSKPRISLRAPRSGNSIPR